MTDTLSTDYVIETAELSSNHFIAPFKPERKSALLIQGHGSHNAAFMMMVELLIDRGYSYITAVRNSGAGPFCSDIQALRAENVYGKIQDFSRTLTSIDVLFTAIIGASVMDAVLYIPDNTGTPILASSLRDAFSQVPAHHIIHYACPDKHAGDFARLLAQAEHPEYGKRHIGIAPTIPSVERAPYSPFHRRFFDHADQPTLEARFKIAAKYHARVARGKAYMHYAAVHPALVSATR